MKCLKTVLKVWGVICLVYAACYLCLDLYASVSPYTSFTTGSTSLGEWIGMGLLSLGMARVIELLEKK